MQYKFNREKRLYFFSCIICTCIAISIGILLIIILPVGLTVTKSNYEGLFGRHYFKIESYNSSGNTRKR